jgi:F0F1-type ATP synthase membrane subunit b/b'
VANAAAEFRRLVDDAQTRITAERERTAGQLRDRIVDLALLAASRVTGQTYAEPRVRELAAAVVSQEGLR